MAILTNTALTYDSVGNREDLIDVIYDISPMEVPFSSGLARVEASAVKHEWQTDALAAVNTGNAVIEGDDVTFAAISPTVRVGNYAQISRKEVIIAGTQDAIDKAGRDTELAYQVIKKGRELKRDIEAILLTNQAGVAGNSTTARTLAGLPAWLQSNTQFNSGGAPAGADSGHTSDVPTAGRTDSGTQITFTEQMLKDAMSDAWSNGGQPSVLMANSFNRQKISGFSGIASVTTNADAQAPTHIVASADVYVSDFGNLRVVANRFQRGRDVWGIDFEYVALAVLRPMFTEELAKTGDAEKRMMLMEYTLRVENEAAHFGIFDLTTA